MRFYLNSATCMGAKHMYGDKAEVVVEYFGEYYKVSGTMEIVVANLITGKLSLQIKLLLTPVNIPSVS